MHSRYFLPGLCMFFTAVFLSCSYDFGNVPEGAQITCKSTADCPSGYTCVDYTGRCVKSENLKDQPNVEGPVTLTPSLLKNGATSVLTFDVNKDLAEPPVVIVKLAVETAMIQDAKQSSGKHYVYTYTAKGGEPEGPDCPVTITLKDTFGLQSPVLSGGVMHFDFLVPDVSSSKMEGSPVKAGDKVTFTFNVNKTLKTGKDPVVGFLGDSGLVGSTRAQRGLTGVNGNTSFIKDPSSVPPKYVYTYTATGSEPQDTPQAVTVDLEDDTANAKTGILLDSVVFDFKKPTIKSQAVTPEFVTRGGYVQLTFEASEELGKEPVVTVDGKPMYSAGKAGLVYTYSYQVIGGDSAGLKDTKITLMDRAGNESKDLIGPQANFDFTPPELATNPPPTVTPGMKMKGEVPFELSFTVTKTLTKDPDIVISNGEEKDNITVTKKEQTGLTYVYSGTTPKTGTSPFYGITIKMTDLAGNFSAKPAGTIELDNVPPQVSTTTVGPDPAKLGITIVYTVTPNEALQDKPQITVTNHADPSKALAFSYNAAQNIYTYTTTGSPNEVDGQYDVTVSMVDKAGNPATLSSTTDTTIKPVNLVVSQPTVGTLNVTGGEEGKGKRFSEVNNFNTINLSFPIGKEIKGTGSSLSVKIDDKDFTGCMFTKDADPAISGKYENCKYEVDSVPGLGEGTHTISVTATDAAGNGSTKSTTVNFDFTKPEAVFTSPSQPYYKIGDTTVLYSIKTNKALGGDSYPVVDVYYGANKLDGFFSSKTKSSDMSFTFSRNISGTESSGPYTVKVSMVDPVGNTTLDSPGIGYDMELAAPDVTGNSVSPSAAKAGDMVTLSFTVTKDLGKTPTVRLGAVTLDTAADCVESPVKTYTCSHTAAAQEGDGDKKSEVDLMDLAGNTNTALIGTVTYDVTPASLVSANIIRDPYYAPYNKAGENNFYFSVKDPLTEGPVKATLIVYASEDLNTTTKSPTVAVIGPRALEFTESGSSGKAAVFTYTIKDTDPEGTYTFNVTWNDVIGNPSTAAAPVNLILNKTPPPTTAIDMTKVLFKRVPWGQSDPDNHTTWLPAYMSVKGAPNAVIDKSAVSMIYIYKGNSADPGQLPSTIPGNLIGSTSTINTDGSFSIPQLTTSDLPVVHLVLVSKSGVKGPTVLIKNTEWTATLGGKKPGNVFGNPHGFYTKGLIEPTLEQRYPQEPTNGGVEPKLQEGIGGSWDQTAGVSTPSARSDHAMAYDSTRGKVIMFGGYDYTNNLNDTWEWDGSNWELKTPGNKPSARVGHAIAYDSARGKVVLFGGDTDSRSSNNETWEWDGSNWEQKAPVNKPSARFGHAMAYDSARRKVILFGGASHRDISPQETWEWDGSNWTQRTPANKPSARYSHAMAYDSARGKVVLFGGEDSYGYSNDTWEWDGSNWTQREPVVKPLARVDHAMAYSSACGKVVMFGGWTDSSYFYETWEWDGSNWMQRTPANKPSVGINHAMVYDSALGKVILFGGDSEIWFFNETWEWDGSDWTQRTPVNKPSARHVHAMAYDSARGKVVLFGGYTDELNNGLNDETWEWEGSNWALKTPTNKPSARSNHAMAYDSARRKVVLFGGLVETWEWDGSDWTKRTPVNEPSARFGHAMAYDSTHGKVVLFGGNLHGLWNDETWEWDGSDWTQRTPANKPSARYGHAMAYDSARGKVVLFGGYSGGGETWEWDGSNWTQRVPVAKPSARANHAMAYDSARERVVLFGGADSDCFNDTWEWDGSNWELKTPVNKPSVREWHAMAYDSARGKVVLFGGYRISPLSPNDETWVWNGGANDRAGQIMNVAFESSGIAAIASVQSVSVLFNAGGSGYTGPNCGAVDGAKMMLWNTAYRSGAWVDVATNSAPATLPGTLEWSTTDKDVIDHIFFGDTKAINVAVTPVSPNGCGSQIGSVATSYAEVMVKYTLP